MNYIDIFFLTALALFFGVGLWAGLVKSLFKLAAWIGGMVGAYFGYIIAGDFFIDNIDVDPVVIKVLCHTLGFIIPFFSLILAGHFLTRLLKATPLSGFNRLGGAGFGILKALIFCGFLTGLICLLPLSGTFKEQRDSSLGVFLYREAWNMLNENESVQEQLKRVIPSSLKEGVPPLPETLQ